jgi:hypothetical protein
MPGEGQRVLLRNGNPQGNPMNAPRCRAPAMANGRCRMHGGKSTGPRTEAGLARSRAARLKHGRYSRQSRQARRYRKELRALMYKYQQTVDFLLENGPDWRVLPQAALPPELPPRDPYED